LYTCGGLLISAQPDILLIVCGSATSWMINKLLKNHGGLNNRFLGIATKNEQDSTQYGEGKQWIIFRFHIIYLITNLFHFFCIPL